MQMLESNLGQNVSPVQLQRMFDWWKLFVKPHYCMYVGIKLDP